MLTTTYRQTATNAEARMFDAYYKDSVDTFSAEYDEDGYPFDANEPMNYDLYDCRD